MSRRASQLLALGLLILVAVWAYLRREVPAVEEKAEGEERLVLEPAAFADLPGWQEDDPSAALSALLRSCEPLLNKPPEELLGIAGKAGDWRPACEAAARVPAGPAETRKFFESHFQPFMAKAGRDAEGLFTGYYEPLLHGSRERSERYRVPLHVRPPELVMVDLGDFREELKGQRIAGKVEEGELVPYPDRRAIGGGALAGRDLELVWVDDPVDAFFLEIQGSGRIELDEGGEMRVGYAAQTAIPTSPSAATWWSAAPSKRKTSPCSRSGTGWKRIRTRRTTSWRATPPMSFSRS